MKHIISVNNNKLILMCLLFLYIYFVSNRLSLSAVYEVCSLTCDLINPSICGASLHTTPLGSIQILALPLGPSDKEPEQIPACFSLH